MFSPLMPPVGINRTDGKTGAIALSIERPPNCSAGKNFNKLNPSNNADIISVEVATFASAAYESTVKDVKAIFQ